MSTPKHFSLAEWTKLKFGLHHPQHCTTFFYRSQLLVGNDCRDAPRRTKLFRRTFVGGRQSLFLPTGIISKSLVCSRAEPNKMFMRKNNYQKGSDFPIFQWQEGFDD